MAQRAGAILAVADVEQSVAFYRDRLGFEVEAMYDDPRTGRSRSLRRGCRWPSSVTRRRTGRGS